jgi:hypothetical protein
MPGAGGMPGQAQQRPTQQSSPEKQLRDLFGFVKQDCAVLYQIGQPQTFGNK